MDEKILSDETKREALFNELIAQQWLVFLKTARFILPHITQDDLLQPNDFSELEHHPLVRYEEGVLHGLQAAKAAFLRNPLK